MVRLSRILANQGRAPEASQWLEKALKLAPMNTSFRRSYINLLVDDSRFSEAIKQFEVLDRIEPNNPDILRDWGKLILRDLSITEPQRSIAAGKIWQRLLEARPKDPVVATQVADLFRHAQLSDQALQYYQKAIELAPDQPQFLE